MGVRCIRRIAVCTIYMHARAINFYRLSYSSALSLPRRYRCAGSSGSLNPLPFDCHYSKRTRTGLWFRVLARPTRGRIDYQRSRGMPRIRVRDGWVFLSAITLSRLTRIPRGTRATQRSPGFPPRGGGVNKCKCKSIARGVVVLGGDDARYRSGAVCTF